jgi:hypothetical protein
MFFASSKPWSVSLHITSPSTACSRGNPNAEETGHWDHCCQQNTSRARLLKSLCALDTAR